MHAGSSGSRLQDIIADRTGDVRLEDGTPGNGVAKKASRLCVTLKDFEGVSIGDEIQIHVRRHQGRIRVTITADRKHKVVRLAREE
jgi:hypothetical protein